MAFGGGYSGVRTQTTIAGPAMCAGIGVHSGAHTRLVVKPAEPNAGIVFVRTDVARDNRISAIVANVSSTMLGTTLTTEAGVTVETVEHFMAACAGLGIDNLIVEIDGPELPILDGSAAPFVQLLENAGRRTQGASRRVLRILERIEVIAGVKSAALVPALDAEDLELDVTIRFADPAIGTQRRHMELTRARFLSEIAGARTFGFMEDVAKLHAVGRGRGASLDNAVVIEDGRIMNPEGLRFEDEFVRHKMLDAIGDLALAGGAIAGRYEADQPGHALNLSLLTALFARPEAWPWEALDEATPALAAAAG